LGRALRAEARLGLDWLPPTAAPQPSPTELACGEVGGLRALLGGRLGLAGRREREREREGEGGGGERGRGRGRGGEKQAEGEPAGMRVPRRAGRFASAEESQPACAHRGEPNRSGGRGWGGLVRTMRGRPRGCWRTGWAEAVCWEGRSGAGARAE
jgi:hypothetical protein